jgi:polyphosphate kinase 2 (PPK2 family)
VKSEIYEQELRKLQAELVAVQEWVKNRGQCVVIVFEGRDKKFSPWNIVPSDDKKRAHLNCISHILSSLPYEPLGTAVATLPEPDQSDAYNDRKSLQGRQFIPEIF